MVIGGAGVHSGAGLKSQISNHQITHESSITAHKSSIPVRRLLALILFLFEPWLAATLLLRLGMTIADRDALTYVAIAGRVALALASVAAAMALGDRRPGGERLATWVLAASAAFAVFQYLTRALPTSVPPDLAPILTTIIVVHHLGWIGLLRFSRNR